MSFAFAPRLAPSILRPNVLHSVLPTLKLNAGSNSLSRSLVTTSLAKNQSKGDTSQPPELRKDGNWEIFQKYTSRNVTPKMTPEELWRERSKKHEALGHPSIYAGRSILVKNGDVSTAMRFLAVRLRENDVRNTWKYQMRHEKKGVKRRRLSSERWRRRFSDEIRRKIELVRSIQRRGQ